MVRPWAKRRLVGRFSIQPEEAASAQRGRVSVSRPFLRIGTRARLISLCHAATALSGSQFL
jgi:hypothetical protein